MPGNWSTGTGATIADLGEEGLLSLIREIATIKDPSVVLPIGDDAAAYRSNGATVLTSVDAMVEEQHFRRSWLSPADLGRRLFRVAASDILAMGGTPRWVVLSLQLPSTLPVSAVHEFVSSFQEECSQNSCSWIGGNLTRSDSMSLHLTVMGIPVGGAALWRRSGAQEGDILWLTGNPGVSGAGLSLLLSENRDQRFEELRAGWRSPRNLRDLVARLRGDDSIHACIDLSDGLLLDASRMAKESNKEFVIYSDRFIPYPIQVEAAHALGLAPQNWSLNGGESYELLFASSTEPPQDLLDQGAFAIGEVKAGRGDSSNLVRVQTQGSPEIESSPEGWDPFREKKQS